MFPLLNVSIVLLISGFIKRIIPEDFVRRTRGAFEHRVVFSVRWENSWQLWLEREKNELFMIEEDWNEFVDDNHLGPNDNLFIKHDETMNLEVQIFKNNGVEIIDVPLGVEPETEPFHPTPKKPHKETTPASSFASGSGCSGKAIQIDRIIKLQTIICSLCQCLIGFCFGGILSKWRDKWPSKTTF